MRNNDYDREEMNAIQRERYARRMRTRRKSAMTTVFTGAIIVAVVAAIVVAAVSLTKRNLDNQSTPSETVAVTATIAQATESSQETKPAPTRSAAHNDAQTAVRPTDSSYDSEDDDSNNDDTASETYAQQTAPAPVSDGDALHVYAYGKTSYGYDWTYSGNGSGVVAVTCNYDFSANSYDFVLTGQHEGTDTITLYYNTDDGVQVPMSMTVSVDSDLNVTRIG